MKKDSLIYWDAIYTCSNLSLSIFNTRGQTGPVRKATKVYLI